MTIDGLAMRAGTTTRNVRALQTASLLVKPEMVGRTAHYGETHLARLIAVLRLQKHGFSIASIRALLEAMAAGRSLADVLGVSPNEPSEDPFAHRQWTDPSPGAFGDPFVGESPDASGGVAASGTRTQFSHIRLLSDLPTTVLDLAI